VPCEKAYSDRVGKTFNGGYQDHAAIRGDSSGIAILVQRNALLIIDRYR
jgi:hypothetical protein